MKTLLIAFGLLTAAQPAFAVDPPSAGSQLQQIPAMSAPAVPSDTATDRPLDLQHPRLPAPIDAAPAPGDTRLLIKTLRVRNARAFSEQQLIAASGFRPASELSLADLHRFAAVISNYYRDAGYILAEAVVPAQEVVDGVVDIHVTEGAYGRIELRNSSRLSDHVAARLLSGLHRGQTVAIQPLENRLLQLADLPGVVVRSSLAPGSAPGASDLIVNVTPGRRVTGSVDADNSGSRYTGANRFGGSVNFNNLAGRGDVVTLRALTSWDGLNYGRAGYQMRLGRADAGLAYTALDYELGREFEALEAHGTAKIASVYGSYPLLRQRAVNLNATLNFEAKRFEDIMAFTDPSTVTHKRTRAATLGLSGNHHDEFGGGGISLYSLGWTFGELRIDSADAALLDAATAGSHGHYDKLGLRLQRLQRVSESVTLYGALQSQFTAQNLDVSEKLGLGGASSVRAYPEGEAYADQGYLLSIEARVTLAGFAASMPGNLQWVAFLDTARGTLNRDPWSSGRNHRSLSGGGFGIHWFEARGFELKAYYAHTLGGTAGTSTPDGDGRLWFNASKQF